MTHPVAKLAALARTVERTQDVVMTEAKFALGADVAPIQGGRGHVLESRYLNDSEWIYGVVTTNGEITYYQERALRSADGMY